MALLNYTVLFHIKLPQVMDSKLLRIDVHTLVIHFNFKNYCYYIVTVFVNGVNVKFLGQITNAFL